MSRLNLHIYPSPFTAESRIQKETESLLRSKIFDEIALLGIQENDLPVYEVWPNGIKVYRIKLLSKRSKFRLIRYCAFIEFFTRALFSLSKFKASVVNCHSIHVLPLGVWHKKKYGSTLIYDAHELETEVNGLSGYLKKVTKLMERKCIKYADEVIVVSDLIKEWYIKTYNPTHITAIYNIPEKKSIPAQNSGNFLKAQLGIKEDELLFIYQGALTPQRGIKTIVDAFEQLTPRHHIVFMGSGPMANEIKQQSTTHPNIHYLKSVKPAEVLSYTCCADCGIHIIQNTCLNHYYCLPNKIFEYLFAGIPFIVSAFPEMQKVTAATQAGWTVETDRNALVTQIMSITPENIREKKQNALNNRFLYGWEKEEVKYQPILERINNKHGHNN